MALARKLRVGSSTIAGWEKGRITPPTVTMGRVMQWLGYDPMPTGGSLAERLLAKRRAMGWTQEEIAKALGVHRSVYADWERGGRVHFRAYRRHLARFLG